MTLNDIIVAALSQIDRGHDAQTLDVWRDKLTLFANDAIADLALAIKPVRSEAVSISGGRVDCSALQRECLKAVSLSQNGRELAFDEEAEQGALSAAKGKDGQAELKYRFMPKALSAATDEPELPARCHPLIVTYVVARERASGDVGVQRGASIYFQLYETGKQRLRPHMGGEGAFAIRNRW